MYAPLDLRLVGISDSHYALHRPHGLERIETKDSSRLLIATKLSSGGSYPNSLRALRAVVISASESKDLRFVAFKIESILSATFYS
jgi:hypothetical protein